MDHLIEVNGISFGYTDEQLILNNISASVLPGQLITLLGPNGVGKSTLLGCMTGLLSPSAGAVLLEGKPIGSYSRRKIAQSIAFVPQKTAVSFDYTVSDFVLMGRTCHLGIFSVPSDEDRRRTELALERLGISGLRDRPVRELSGGEQQKVCIARAIVQDPKLIIMDEPTSSLDYGNQIHVLKLIKALSEAGYSVLMTTHNPEHSLLLDGDVWLLGKNGGLSCGSADELISEQTLSALYGTDICITEVSDAGRRACFIRTLK